MPHPSEHENTGSDPAYEDAVRRVLWGEDRRQVMEALLRRYKLPFTEAEEIYRRAVAERVADLRDLFRRRMITGCQVILGSLVMGVVTWFATDGFQVWEVSSVWSSRRSSTLTVLPVVAAGLFLGGIWMVIDGAAGWLTAESRAGAVADVEE